LNRVGSIGCAISPIRSVGRTIEVEVTTRRKIETARDSWAIEAWGIVGITVTICTWSKVTDLNIIANVALSWTPTEEVAELAR